MLLAKDGKALSAIAVRADATETERYAASELRSYLEMITGAPFELTKGKNHVTVKFYAHNHNIAGGIFDLRMLKEK